jgi:hypothetical protein
MKVRIRPRMSIGCICKPIPAKNVEMMMHANPESIIITPITAPSAFTIDSFLQLVLSNCFFLNLYFTIYSLMRG